MPPHVYIIRPAIYAPMILAMASIGLAIGMSWWWLAALPFIWLGSICAQPNMNFADGFLAWLSLFIGLNVLAFHQSLGIAICTGTILSYVTSVCEKPCACDLRPRANFGCEALANRRTCLSYN